MISSSSISALHDLARDLLADVDGALGVVGHALLLDVLDEAVADVLDVHAAEAARVEPVLEAVDAPLGR